MRTTKTWWREVSSQMSNCVRLRFFSSCCWALTTFVANHRRTIVSRLVGDQFLFAIVRHRLRSGSSKLSRLLPDVCTHYWSPMMRNRFLPGFTITNDSFRVSIDIDAMKYVSVDNFCWLFLKFLADISKGSRREWAIKRKQKWANKEQLQTKHFL